MAEYLSRQGHAVFVSSHAEVRKYVEEYGTEEYAIVFPAESLETDYLNRLNERYRMTGLEKDKKAYEFMKNSYHNSISELSKECSSITDKNLFKGAIEINQIEYDLSEILRSQFRP